MGIKYNFPQHHIIIGALALIFIIEFIATFLLNILNFESTRVTGYYKIGLQLFFLSTIFFNKILLKIIYSIAILASLVCVNQLILNPIFFENLNFNFLKGSLYYFNKYIYVFIFIVAFYSWKHKDIIVNYTMSIIEKLLIINSFFILMGFFFEISFFKSYHPDSIRFGYDGFFNKVNEVSYLYMIFLLNLYHSAIKKHKRKFLFGYIIFISLLLGTKVIILFLGLLSLFHLLVVIKLHKRYKILLSTLILIVLVFIKTILNFLFNLFPFWEKLNDEYSLITLLSSKRNLLVLDNIEYFKNNWTWLNYFIGGSFYTENFAFCQMDFFDPFMIFGATGVIIYMFLIKKYFFDKRNTIKNGLLIIIFICGTFAGGLLLSTMSMVYLFFTSKYIKFTR